MIFNYALVFALAVYGASAQFLGNGYEMNGYNGAFGGYGGRVSDVCRCVKTVVRPQIRTEVTTIPTVQRFVRTEATPVIERIPYAVNRRVDAPSYLQNGIYSNGLNGIAGGYGGVGTLSGVSTLNDGFVY